MKVTVDDKSSVKKQLHIEVPLETVTAELDSAYRSIKKNAKIKGFRPGKAPRSVLERLFKKDVHSDVSAKLIQSSFMEAIKETDLNIVGTPKIDPPEMKTDEPYCYDADVEVAPDIEPIDFKGLSLKKTVYEVSDGEIEGQLHMLQQNLSERNPIEEERAVAEGDFVRLDYEGFKDDKPFEETQKTENYIMKIGQGAISADLDNEIVGMMPGEEKDIPVSFPEDHFNNKLAGSEITFKVNLHEIREEILPEIDDAFAKRLGEYENLDALKSDIGENLKQGYEKRTEQELNEQIFQALIERTDFEVPDVMINAELEGILNEAERSFSMREMSMEDAGITREGLSEQYRDTAEKQVRRHLILDQIIQQEDLTLSDEELENGYEEMAKATRQPVDAIKDFYQKNQQNLGYFKNTLLEKQAIRLIIEQGEIEEVAPEQEDAADNTPKV